MRRDIFSLALSLLALPLSHTPTPHSRNSLAQAVNEGGWWIVLYMLCRGALLRGINCDRLVRRRDKSLQ